MRGRNRNENVRSGILLRHEYVKFKPNKLKFNIDKDKWYKYDVAPEFVSKIKPIYTASMLGQYKGRKATEFNINILLILKLCLLKRRNNPHN